MIGILLLSYISVLLLSPEDISDYTVADTEYWRESGNRLMLKTTYDYNNREQVEAFPKTLGEWKGSDFRYPDGVYNTLKADMLLSRTYTKEDGSLVWMDLINSKVGESFHMQKICVEGAGWKINNSSIAEFKIGESTNIYAKLRANRLDYSKKDQKQIMVYWFMFKKLGAKDSVAMIRITSPVTTNETDTYNSIKDFVEDNLFRTMYNQIGQENITVAENIMNTYGNLGKVALVMGILIPIGIIFAGIRRKN
jgi:hypothetical protein